MSKDGPEDQAGGSAKMLHGPCTTPCEMTLQALLTFAYEQRPPYFDPDDDIEVFDPNEEDWEALRVTSTSLPLLIDGLEQDVIPESRIRFADSVAEEYLTHLMDGEFDEELHHEDKMNRERVVGFADAGYTSVDDLLGTDDPIDIGRETGVNRDVVSSIATNHVGGFSTGGSFGSGGPLSDLDPRDDVPGWELRRASGNIVTWVSPGRFTVEISPSPKGDVVVNRSGPRPEEHGWQRKRPIVEGSETTGEEALEAAHQWLSAHALEYEEDLAQLPQIGLATQDYLVLAYGITTEEELRSFAEDSPDEFDSVFGSRGEKLRAVLEL